MDAIDAILSRRSIRRYTGESVPSETMELLLRAAVSAPSAGNRQPWRFIVIDDKDILRKIPTVHPYSSMVPQAAAAILICADLALEKHPGYWVQDCAAATQNILVAARSLGLGSVWLGVYPRDDRVSGLKRLLGLPENIMPLSLVPVGIPAEEKPPSDRYNPERIHRNRW
ncbi:MAG TPA: nitroreductase family protein [Candidatus Aquicultor sp.]